MLDPPVERVQLPRRPSSTDSYLGRHVEAAAHMAEGYKQVLVIEPTAT